MKNSLVICVDDLRRDVCDRQSKYFCMPYVAELAKRSQCFRKAFTTSSWSPQVAYTVFKDCDPIFTPFAVEAEDTQKVFRHGLLSSARFRRREYLVGVSANIWVSAQFGFDKFFDRWIDDRANAFERCCKLLSDGLPEPWVVYLQIMHVHDRLLGKRAERNRDFQDFAYYRRCCHELDTLLGKELLPVLERKGLTDRTVVCLFSDHGESFPNVDSDGLKAFGHGQALSPILLRVPLFICDPDREAANIDEYFSLRHLFQTVFACADGKEFNLPEPVISAFLAHKQVKHVKFDGRTCNGSYQEFDLVRGDVREFKID